MPNKPLRVVVWGTGGIGCIAISAVVRRPDMQLVGVWVNSQAKVGRDSGELAGIAATGVKTTNDKDALIALKPDCVVYCANPPEREAAAVPDYVRLLKAGINVVSTTTSKMIYPPHLDKPLRDQLETAAQAGNASIYASGIEPGFAGDYLPLVLATQSRSIRSIRTSELGIYDDWPVAHVLMDAMGFGLPLDAKPHLANPGAIKSAWGGVVSMVADALAVKLEGIREVYERKPTNRDIDAACGLIKAGTCGAIRLQCIGIVNGQDAIIIEHVNRMARDLAPDWPIGKTDLAYRIVIEGEPNLECNLDISLDEDGKKRVGTTMGAGAGAMVSTAMRVVNAIPLVVEARPGLLGTLELPVTVPRHAFAPA